MGSVGIIAEYNPFHNGHLYHLKKVKEHFPNDTIILVMTGNFTERGDVAIVDKWKRTKMALKAGIDLIVELPYPFSTQSADYFSYGALTILEHLKVEKVIFGSESNNLEDLEIIADTQLNNKEFEPLVRIYSKMGENYPTALSLAIKDLTQKEITSPNDLLGISYVKTIKQYKYQIKPLTLQRTNNYHNNSLEQEISSATAIRKALKEDISITKQLPDFVIPYLTELHDKNDYFYLLKYKIITEKDLTIYHGVEEGIEHVLKKEILTATSYQDLITKTKSKRYTYNKISRLLLHILCNFTKEEASSWKKITYIRLLGFNEKGRIYLNQIKKEVQLPIISKISKHKDPMLEFELETTKIYALTLPLENQFNLIKEEYQNHLNKGEQHD